MLSPRNRFDRAGSELYPFLDRMEEYSRQINLKTLESSLKQDYFDFTCREGCSECCKGPGNVYFSGQDLKNIAEYLGLDTRKREDLFQSLITSRENGYYVHGSPRACRFLGKDGLCSIYPVRPLQCSSYPFWPSHFQGREELKFLRNECPGSLTGQGRRFTLLQTLRRVNKTGTDFIAPQTDQDNAFIL